MNSYNHKTIEKKWQDKWRQDGIYDAKDSVPGKDNYYLLTEFTYPSGNLHVGHWYAFAVPDIFARYKRMQGFNVLYPTGFDAFGLPAENAAIKLGADPRVLTYEQMDRMRAQIKSMGASFDWSREVITCDPAYYKWTQWMFNQFLKHDLAYRASTKVNWCPKDQTILANEQVSDGKCDRCGTEVIQKDQEQWMLRITKYADQLIDDLDNLNWPNAIKEAQKNWIGRKEGVVISHAVEGMDLVMDAFSAYPGWLFADTFLVVAPEHPMIADLVKGTHLESEVKSFVEKYKNIPELERAATKEKEGIFTGRYVMDPINKGARMPIWIANFAMMGFGTGIIRCSAHDVRDYEFAQKYTIPLKEVVERVSADVPVNAHGNEGVLKASGPFSGKSLSKETIAEMVDWFVSEGYAKKVTQYRLRDWGISRQRYWGCPIPIVYDPDGNAHPIPDEHLPWILPTDVDHTPDGTAPLARSQELVERTEKIFGKGWKPEVETMDTFVDSSWYFYRYLDPKNETEFSAQAAMDAWMPIDLYMGGAEHTTMHLLYSRFWTKALRDLGLVKDSEAYKIRRNRGLILGPDGNKMSKSKGNVINPDEIVELLGADTVRMYLCFMGPYGVTVNYPWDPNGVVGVRRFIERVWKLSSKLGEGSGTKNLLHKTIKGITEDVEEFKFNTAISKMMILVNAWEKESSVSIDDYKTLLRMLAAFAPHVTEELWSTLGETESIHLSAWPTFDPDLIVEDTVTLGIQVNGKVRADITIAIDAVEQEVKSAVMQMPEITKWTEGKDVKKFIYVPGKIISIVV